MINESKKVFSTCLINLVLVPSVLMQYLYAQDKFLYDFNLPYAAPAIHLDSDGPLYATDTIFHGTIFHDTLFQIAKAIHNFISKTFCNKKNKTIKHYFRRT